MAYSAMMVTLQGSIITQLDSVSITKRTCENVTCTNHAHARLWLHKPPEDGRTGARRAYSGLGPPDRVKRQGGAVGEPNHEVHLHRVNGNIPYRRKAPTRIWYLPLWTRSDILRLSSSRVRHSA